MEREKEREKRKRESEIEGELRKERKRERAAQFIQGCAQERERECVRERLGDSGREWKEGCHFKSFNLMQ